MTTVGLVVLPSSAGGRDATTASLEAQEHRRWRAVLLGAAAAPDARVRAGEGRVLEAALADLADRDGADLLGVVAQGDRLDPRALALLAPAALAAGWAYADEHHDPPGGPALVVRKPGWSPQQLLSMPYTGRPALLRADLVRDCLAEGPLDPAAPEWDLALRAARRTPAAHVPLVLLARPVPPAPVPLEVAARLVPRASGRRGTVVPSPAPGVFWLDEPLDDPPPVTAVIPTAGSVREVRGARRVLVEHCLDRLLAVTDYPALDAVVVVDEKTPADVRERLAQRDRVTLVDRSGGFDFADICNTGVAATSSPLVLLLNDDVEVLEPSWLRRMVAVALRPGVGVVGARLELEDGRLQHVGVAHNADALPAHLQWGDDGAADYCGSATAVRESAAVTAACLLTRRDVYEQVGGLDRRFPVNYNDVDYCMRVLTAGWWVVQCGAARLVHFESSSREPGTTPEEQERYLDLWSERGCRDPWAQMFRWGGYEPPGLSGDPVPDVLALAERYRG